MQNSYNKTGYFFFRNEFETKTRCWYDVWLNQEIRQKTETLYYLSIILLIWYMTKWLCLFYKSKNARISSVIYVCTKNGL